MPRRTGCISHVPGPTGTSVEPGRIEVVSREESPGRDRVDDGQVSIQNAPPATGNLVHSAVVEISRPLLLDESSTSSQGRAWVDGNHVDAETNQQTSPRSASHTWSHEPLDELDIPAEICCMINLVLEELPKVSSWDHANL